MSAGDAVHALVIALGLLAYFLAAHRIVIAVGRDIPLRCAFGFHFKQFNPYANACCCWDCGDECTKPNHKHHEPGDVM